jgi:hypothetical protein
LFDKKKVIIIINVKRTKQHTPKGA